MKACQPKHKVDRYLVGIGGLALLLLALTQLWLGRYGSYWEGRGLIPRGSWLLPTPIGVLYIGIPLCAVFIIRLLFRVRKDEKTTSVMRLCVALVFLVAPVLVTVAAIFLSVSLPREPGCVGFCQGFRDRIDTLCTAEELRAWAQAVLDDNTGRDNATGYFDEQLPPFAERIDLRDEFGPHLHVAVENQIIDICLSGSALSGHFGLLIGPPEFSWEEGFNGYKGDNYYFLGWKPGIYVWYSEN